MHNRPIHSSSTHNRLIVIKIYNGPHPTDRPWRIFNHSGDTESAATHAQRHIDTAGEKNTRYRVEFRHGDSILTSRIYTANP